MNVKGNSFGIQKVAEQEVRKGKDVAIGAGSTAMQYGSIADSMPGAPVWVKPAMMGAGLVKGWYDQKKQQGIERNQNAMDKKQNSFVDTLSGRQAQSDFYSPTQMRKGMKMKGKYSIGEIEGDGSKDYKDGIGEVHFDKNYNIKKIAKGGKTHEEGGVKTVMQEGDSVFPTQNDKGKFKKVIALANRYKLNNDKNAKKQLDKIKDNLPTEEDYEEEGHYPDGLKDYGLNKSTPNSVPTLANATVNPVNTSKGSGELPSPYMFGKDKGLLPNVEDFSLNEKLDGSGNDVSLPLKPNKPQPKYSLPTTTSVLGGDSSTTSEKDNMVEENKLPQPNQSVERKYNLPTSKDILGNNEEPMNKVNVSNPNDTNNPPYENRIVDFILNNQDVKDPNALRQLAKDNGIDPNDYMDVLDKVHGSNVTGTRNSKGDTSLNIGGKTLKAHNDFLPADAEDYEPDLNDPNPRDKRPSPYEETINSGKYKIPKDGVTNQSPNYQSLQTGLGAGAKVGLGLGSDVDAGLEEEVDEDSFEFEKIKAKNNPMRYANMLNNFATGNQEADKVTRRFYSPDEIEYKDRSAVERRENLQGMNAQMGMMRGKGLSAGQQQGYSGQAKAGYLDRGEAINQNEAKRFDQIQQYNVGQGNQAKMQNLTLANQYDTFDDQAKAVKKEYTDKGYKEMSSLAESDTRLKYQVDRDNKAFEIDEKSIPLYQTGNWGYKGTDWNNPVYMKGNRRGSKSVTTNKAPKEKRYTITNGKRNQ